MPKTKIYIFNRIVDLISNYCFLFRILTAVRVSIAKTIKTQLENLLSRHFYLWFLNVIMDRKKRTKLPFLYKSATKKQNQQNQYFFLLPLLKQKWLVRNKSWKKYKPILLKNKIFEVLSYFGWSKKIMYEIHKPIMK